MSGLVPVAQWVTASPLWPAAETSDTMQRPVLLSFTSDTFMEDLQGLLAERPGQLGDYRAQPRSYRAKPPGGPASWVGTLPTLKLYQAAHGQFNLVAASLVCRLPGLPDRTLDTSADETVGFVLRRVVGGSEAAWAPEAASTKRGWRTLAAGAEKRLAAGEEVLPLLPVRYDAQASRRLLVGLVPTSSGDTFKAGADLSPFVAPLDADGKVIDSRMDDFEGRVLGPLDEIRKSPAPPELRTDASRFILVDFAELLTTQLPDIWSALGSSSAPSGGVAGEIYTLLNVATTGASPDPGFRTKLLAAWDQRLRIAGEATPAPTVDVDLRWSTLSTDALRRLLQRALQGIRPEIELSGSMAAMRAATQEGSPFLRELDVERAVQLRRKPDRPIVTDADVPKLDPAGKALYIVRCVFRRPQCTPPVDLLSEPSDRFAIASFFDSDAPTRPIRVQLPVKTSIAELRKYPKNVGFVLSNELQQQMSRVTDLKKIMAGQLADGDEIDVGMLCSFSIPIITICALIVLMIFLNLLNIVFWWMPFLRVCLPISLRGDAS